VTLRELIARLDELPEHETIYAECARPTARAVVAEEPEDGSTPEVAAGLRYIIEVTLAREAVEVWQRQLPGRRQSLADRVAAVIHYAENDAWLPVD
jgi:hypothetical protein